MKLTFKLKILFVWLLLSILSLCLAFAILLAVIVYQLYLLVTSILLLTKEIKKLYKNARKYAVQIAYKAGIIGLLGVFSFYCSSLGSKVIQERKNIEPIAFYIRPV